jgi:hypothetical protein
MKFLLDENFPKSAEKLLLDCGHEVVDIRGTTQQGINDRASLLSKLEWLLANDLISSITNKIILLRDKTYRVR